MKLGIAVLGAALLAGCFAGKGGEAGDGVKAPTMPHIRINFEGEFATPEERKMCEAAGGEVMRVGMLGWENCVQSFADAAKACRDGAECLGGRCMIVGEFADYGAATDQGQCAANDSPFGCYQTVENGKASPALCVD